MFSDDQTWQVKHCTDSDACSRIGRTCGQKTIPSREGDGQFVFQQRVEFVHRLPGFFDLKPRENDLHPKVVFFIDHDAAGFILAQDKCSTLLFLGQFSTDEVAFDQQLAVQVFQ